MKHCNRHWPIAIVFGIFGAGLFLPTASATNEPLWVGKFSDGPTPLPAPWKIEQFDRKVPATQYRLRSWEGVQAVEATASRSMAFLVRPIDIDLAKTPVLCWRWRIAATVKGADIASKSGDDYAARIYLMFRVPEGTLDFSTRTQLALARLARGDGVPDAALNYVWDNKSPVGTVRPNAYTGRAMMWVLQSGDGAAGRWVIERRDVVADFVRAFGHRPQTLYALAIATDTDNTGETATAGFADFAFTTPDAPCS